MTAFSGPAKSHRGIAALMLLLSLGACATAIPSVDVTRFHGETVAREGTVSIVAADRRDETSLEFRATANAVSSAMQRAGFTVLDEGAAGSDFRATVAILRETIQPGDSRRSPVSVGVAGSAGSYGSGLGVGIGIDLSGKPKPIIATQLRVQIRSARDGSAIWEGRAETAAKQGSPAAQPGMAAGKLADALFRDYPGPSGVTITVK